MAGHSHLRPLLFGNGNIYLKAKNRDMFPHQYALIQGISIVITAYSWVTPLEGEGNSLNIPGIGLFSFIASLHHSQDKRLTRYQIRSNM
jgi:hypothetical protein